MLIKIDFNSDTPIYLQLKKQIVEGLAAGEFQEGESLPPVRAMAEDLGINMHTVNKSYNLLKDSGLVSIDRRYGAVINTQGAKLQEDFLEETKDEIKALASECYIRGMNKNDFLNLCKEVYEIFEVKKNE